MPNPNNDGDSMNEQEERQASDEPQPNQGKPPEERLEHSEAIGEIAKALSKAQGAIDNAKKKSENPFFKSQYADLAACIDVCKEALTANGLAIVQSPFNDNVCVGVVTLLAHESGEWIKSTLKLKPIKGDPQTTGATITYARRYSLCAVVGIAQEDDDGNTATKGRSK